MKLTDCLNEQSRELWPELYRKFTKREWQPPEKDKRAIRCEPKLESIEEIDRQMRKKPNYVIEKQGREG